MTAARSGRCRRGSGRPPARPASIRAATDDVRIDLKAFIIGSRQTTAGTIYGTIVALSVVTAGAKAFEHDLWGLSGIAAMTVLVFWVAHLYSHGLGESLNLGRRLTAAELAAIARREASILLAAVVPVAMILLGALGVFGGRTALWLAVGTEVAALAVQGLRYARLEQRAGWQRSSPRLSTSPLDS